MTTKTATANIARYNAELNRLEIAPNGDDYDAILRLLAGGDYVAPVRSGR